MKNILLVDGENLKKKIEAVFKELEEEGPDWGRYNFRGLFDSVLEGISIEERIFYIAKISKYEETEKQSLKLIAKQRALKNNLMTSGFTVVSAGNVRGWPDEESGKLIFREKGVDVRIAVDIVVKACIDGDVKTVILGSSDSDLQPAIAELNKRGVNSIYLGFENNPNKGLTYTTKRTILIRNSEVVKFRGPEPLV